MLKSTILILKRTRLRSDAARDIQVQFAAMCVERAHARLKDAHVALAADYSFRAREMRTLLSPSLTTEIDELCNACAAQLGDYSEDFVNLSKPVNEVQALQISALNKHSFVTTRAYEEVILQRRQSNLLQNEPIFSNIHRESTDSYPERTTVHLQCTEQFGLGLYVAGTTSVPVGATILKEWPCVAIPASPPLTPVQQQLREASISCDECAMAIEYPVTQREPRMGDQFEIRCPRCVAARSPAHRKYVQWCSKSCAARATRHHAMTCRNKMFLEFDRLCVDTLRSYEENEEEPFVGEVPAKDICSGAQDSLTIIGTCRLIGRICALATSQGVHPLELKGLRHLSGYVKYSSVDAFHVLRPLCQMLRTALNQPYLFLEDFMAIYALIQQNEIRTSGGGFQIYSVLSILNHSCTPNAEVILGKSGEPSKIVAIQPINSNEQILIDYNPKVTSLSYDQRFLYHKLRGFSCLCTRCSTKS